LDDCSAQVFPYNIFTYCSICTVECKFTGNKKNCFRLSHLSPFRNNSVGNFWEHTQNTNKERDHDGIHAFSVIRTFDPSLSGKNILALRPRGRCCGSRKHSVVKYHIFLPEMSNVLIFREQNISATECPVLPCETTMAELGRAFLTGSRSYCG
jgi:hypothetical protein